MDKRICCVILIIFSLAVGQQIPVVRYLRGVLRLSNPSIVDYYFSCGTIGETLQWEVNQDAIGFNAGGRIGSVNTSSSPNISYTATLLSSQQFQGVLYTFGSVLIVSSIQDVNINVSCTNGIETTPISSSTISTEILRETPPDVFLQYLFSVSILNAITTYFYLCGVNGNSQAWLTNAQAFGFNNNNNIGTDEIFLTGNRMTVLQQAILIANEPPVSILLVAGISRLNVTCRASQSQATLLFSEVLNATTMATPAPTTDASTTTDITTDNSTEIGTTGNTDVNSTAVPFDIIAGVAIGICVILAVVLILVCIYICVLKARDKRIPIGAVPLQPISPGSDNKA